MFFASLASHDNQLISNFINFHFFFIENYRMYVEVCSCICSQSISEYQLLGISCWFFSFDKTDRNKYNGKRELKLARFSCVPVL